MLGAAILWCGIAFQGIALAMAALLKPCSNSNVRVTGCVSIVFFTAGFAAIVGCALFERNFLLVAAEVFAAIIFGVVVVRAHTGRPAS